MQSLREAFTEAQAQGVALGHFNISDSTQFRAVIDAAAEAGVPIVIGVSEGEREFIGVHEAAGLVRSMKEEGRAVYLNADHTHTLEGCREAIDAGFDSVIFDGSAGPVEDNIGNLKEVLAYARASGRDVMIEGELGYIGSSSKLLDAVPDDVVASALPSAEEAADFVSRSGIDAFAPAVGNIHGMLKGRTDPALAIDLIRAIHSAVPTPLVLHGASGNTDADIRAAVAAGIAMVHVNTELRVAYRRGIEEGLAANAEEIAPYRYLDHGYRAAKALVLEKLALYSAH